MKFLLTWMIAFFGSAIWYASAAYKMTSFVIRPPSFNDRGYIGAGKTCPEMEVAIGFRMKMHHHVRDDFSEPVEPDRETGNNNQLEVGQNSLAGRLDNTALNAVRLLCSGGTEAQSYEGNEGLWTDFLRCQGKSDYIVGVRLKSERWRGWSSDDVGATNFEAVCKSGARLLHQPVSTWINDRGEWGEMVYCPKRAPAVCGIKTRIDNSDPRQVSYDIPDKRNDRAGLTQVLLRCCDL